jgi:hypothetical protein
MNHLNSEKNRLERSKRMGRMSLAWMALALIFSSLAYIFLPPQSAESFYMVSGVFIAMAFVCYYIRP